jgi:uncharacterized membrane protein YkoI
MGRLILISLISLIFISHGNSFADEHNEAYELLNSGKILPLEKILEIVSQAEISGQILEVELEHKNKLIIYELEILDKEGVVWEIKVDASTGAIIKQERG